MGFDAVLHDGQEGLDEAGDAGAAADVLHRTIHVVGAATQTAEVWERPWTPGPTHRLTCPPSQAAGTGERGPVAASG